MRTSVDLRHVARELLDLVVPPRCGGCGEISREVFCPTCAPEIELIDGPYCPACGHPHPPTAHGWPPCVDCRGRRRPALDGARSVGFHVGPLREAVIEFKFHNRRELTGALGAMLARRFDNEYARPHRLPFDEVDAIVPVVLHPARRKWRGYDQATLLARELAAAARKPLWEDVLVRVRDTKPQVELSATQRAENIRGAFEARKVWRLKGAALLLIDDVYTTGATLLEAARVLKRAGVGAAYGLTLTRTAPEWHPKSFPTLQDAR